MQRPGFEFAQAPTTGDVTCGRELRLSPSINCAVVRFGLTLTIRLSTPDTSGVEKLVPSDGLALSV